MAPTANDPETLASIIKESLQVGYQITTSSFRFLQKDAEVRKEKGYTLVVVAIPSDFVHQITPKVLVHGKWKKSAVMWSSNPTRQCTKCYLYGHPEEGCKANKYTCPICAGEHRIKDHKCSSPTCPSKGDRKIIADCCPLPPTNGWHAEETTQHFTLNALLRLRLKRMRRNTSTDEGDPASQRLWTSAKNNG